MENGKHQIEQFLPITIQNNHNKKKIGRNLRKELKCNDDKHINHKVFQLLFFSILSSFFFISNDTGTLSMGVFLILTKIILGHELLHPRRQKKAPNSLTLSHFIVKFDVFQKIQIYFISHLHDLFISFVLQFTLLLFLIHFSTIRLFFLAIFLSHNKKYTIILRVNATENYLYLSIDKS